MYQRYLYGCFADGTGTTVYKNVLAGLQLRFVD
ncbi:hypothetical protein EMIT0194MI4_20167 [Pseudomonas sp. IT-194MI4]|jgi:hypothetical protein